MKANVGDEIIVINHGKEFYDAGAKGTVVQVAHHGCLVRFTDGKFKSNHSGDSWFVANSNLKVVRE